MREILFRGKRCDNGEWLEGWYQPPVSGTHIDGRKENLGASIAFVDYDGFLEDAFIIPKTVGQFTGKTVKNGKVFDGDILKSIDGIFLVRWDEEKSAFVMRFLEYPFETLYLEEMWDDAEIIGNIHDNPELLENP